MDLIIPILAAVVGLVLVVFLVVMFKSHRSGGGKVNRSANRDAIIKDATKRLEQNPRDTHALAELGNLYFTEENWDQAYKTYSVIAELGSHGHN